jgi:hypothetical protein
LKVLSTPNQFEGQRFVADKVLDQGRGGVSRMPKWTGMSRTTITKAAAEPGRSQEAKMGPTREDQGGRAQRKRVEQADKFLPEEPMRIFEEPTAGDPMSALRSTNKSTQSIAEELTRRGHPVSDKTVARGWSAPDLRRRGRKQEQPRRAWNVNLEDLGR